MNTAFEPIPQEVKDRMAGENLRPFEAKPIALYLNPHSKSYWVTNGLFLTAALIGRSKARRVGSPTLMWSTVAVVIPYFALISKAKLDWMEDFLGHRKTLEERLEYAPITRRAWERAQEENKSYQDQLKSEIDELEMALLKKGASIH